MAALWLSLPVIVGGLAHILIIRLNLFPGLAKVPLDLGLRLRGKPLFGGNKTLRGAIAMMGTTSIASLLQRLASETWPWAENLMPVPFAQEHPTPWGLILGAGYILGELPNSFLKRRLGALPGEPVDGHWKSFFWIFDQLDSFLGIVLVMCLVWVPPLPMVFQLGLITLLVHPSLTVISGMGRRRTAGQRSSP